MVWNSGENEQGPEVVPVGVPEVVPPRSSAVVPESGSPLEPALELTPEPEVTTREVAIRDPLQKWRNRFSDLSRERFDQMVQDLRDGMAVRAVARGLVQEGLMAHIGPMSVRVYVKYVRELLDVQVPEDETPLVEVLPSEDVEPEEIEGQPSFKQLKWLTRVQHARVRKALALERMMGQMILPAASHEIQIMQGLVDKGIEVSLKTGEMKQAPTKVEIETPPELKGVTQAEAYRVILAYERLMKMGPKIIAAAEALPPETESE